MITIADLRARVAALKAAQMFAKAAAAELVMDDLLRYLASQDLRIHQLEKGVEHGKG